MRRLVAIRSLLFALFLMSFSAGVFAQIGVGISVNFGPPAIPVYEQPICPQEGYIWTPGYWYYGDGEYFWVPGTWVLAPEPGFLWTPGYWGWGGSAFFWHAGYWGPHIGFTAELTMDLVTSVMDMMADAGKTTISTTTPTSTT